MKPMPPTGRSFFQALCLTTGALGVGFGHADCNRPVAPAMLDASDDRATFQAAHQATHAYLQEAKAYLKCLEETEKEVTLAQDEDDSAASETRLKAYNATVDDMRKVSTNMKEEERKFKAQPSE